MSFDAVLNIFMEGIEPGDFKRRWRAANRQAAKQALAAGEKWRVPRRVGRKASARANPLSTRVAERPLSSTHDRSALEQPLSPGAGMESAFRLFKIGRTDA